MSNIKYFNVDLGLNGDIVTGSYIYDKGTDLQDHYPFRIGENEKFEYKTGEDGQKIDIWKAVLDFFKDHNPVSDLTRTNIDHRYIAEYFDCVRLDRLYDDIYRYAEVYEDLYNGYCNDTARGGKTSTWDNNHIPVPALTSPVSETNNGGTCANGDAEIFIKIRGIPIPMRKYKLSDNTLMWKFPEYAFGFDNAIECMSTAAIPTNTISEASYTDNTFKRDAAKNPPNYTQEDLDGNTEIRLGALNIVPDVNE